MCDALGPAVIRLNGPPSLNDADENRDDGQQKQEMDEPTQGVVRDHPDQPHQEKQYGDRPEHLAPPRSLGGPGPARARPANHGGQGEHACEPG